ncbi:MAG: DUF167 domain-containing protein [Pseudomonadales bacterium]|nr:DUF167 domain-containing protein [Pseudomonadales bacterium]
MSSHRNNENEASTRLAIKVVPGSSRDEIVGWLGPRLKIKVRMPPENGKANAAVEKLVADCLGLAPRCVSIVAGHGMANKTLAIEGLDADAISLELGKP